MYGFLGTRGSFMLDLVFAAMIGVVPILLLSWYLVRKRRAYRLHKVIQLVLAVVLLLAVVGFEIEMRLSGWTHLAEASPYWVDGRWNDWIDYSLAIQLCFAIPTPFLWGGLIFAALRRFPSPPGPSAHSRRHVIWGTISMLFMMGTSVTGWVFYWLAFAAESPGAVP